MSSPAHKVIGEVKGVMEYTGESDKVKVRTSWEMCTLPVLSSSSFPSHTLA